MCVCVLYIYIYIYIYKILYIYKYIYIYDLMNTAPGCIFNHILDMDIFDLWAPPYYSGMTSSYLLNVNRHFCGITIICCIIIYGRRYIDQQIIREDDAFIYDPTVFSQVLIIAS